MEYEQLKLENQLCFPLYAASHLIIREYQPHLDILGITYPQYLVMLVLWENDGISVNEITRRLILNTNTVTPLLKRMEKIGIISRKRLESDERKVIINLTEKGQQMKDKAAKIPQNLLGCIAAEKMGISELTDLRSKLNHFIDSLI
ncbi:MAG: MarR family transcriptional regulator [Bacteroidales bacterium]|jgi:DNA-binding MarR family transcriptional regulator